MLKLQHLKKQALSLAVLVLTSFWSLKSYAQDGLDIDVNLDVDEKDWYENPWIWLGVAAVVIIALLLSRSKK